MGSRRPPPRGYRVVEAANGRLIGVGIGLLTAGWVTAVLAGGLAAAAEEDDRPDPDDHTTADDWTPLYIPVAGPFIAIGTLDARPSGLGLLVADGVLQAAGLLGIVLGVADTSHKLVLYDVGQRVELAPEVGASFQGVRAKGEF